MKATSAALALLLATAAEAAPLLFHGHGHGLSFSSDGTALFAPSERALYASGQPQAGRPARGLLRSTDGGNTWRAIALEGEADFPMLAAGYRSGALYVVNTKANSVMPTTGIYVSPDEGKSWRGAAGVVAAATGSGLYLSRDAGGSFRRLDGRQRRTVRLPRLEGDYVTCLAQSPRDARDMAFATRRREVYVTGDGGANWRRIAGEEEPSREAK